MSPHSAESLRLTEDIKEQIRFTVYTAFGQDDDLAIEIVLYRHASTDPDGGQAAEAYVRSVVAQKRLMRAAIEGLVKQHKKEAVSLLPRVFPHEPPVVNDWMKQTAELLLAKPEGLSVAEVSSNKKVYLM